MCWGSDGYGQASKIPQLDPGESCTSHAAGMQHTAALTSKGRLLFWGDDREAQASKIPQLEPGER